MFLSPAPRGERPGGDTPHQEWPLSPRGLEQAQRLATALDGLELDRLVSSPYRRALQTVMPLARRRQLPVEIVDDLRERDVSGGRWLEDFVAVMKRSWEEPEFRLPGCESSGECQARALAAVRSLAVPVPGERLLLSGHGNWIGLVLRAVDCSYGLAEWASMGNPALFEVRLDGEDFIWVRETRLPEGDGTS